jgi:hypothetical protein
MKPSSISPKVATILCAATLAIGMVAHGTTVTPPSQSITPAKTPTPIKTAQPAPSSNPPAIFTPVSPSVPNPFPLTTPNSPPLVAVPTLTPALLKNFTNLYGQLLTVKFTPIQQQKIARRVSKDWMLNLGLRNTVLQTIAQEPQIMRGTPAERTQLQAKLVEKLRQQVLDGDADALWLVSFYDALPKNWLAPGTPPLTRMTTDMSADVLCFMVNEVMGKSVATSDSKLKNAIAAKLTAEYRKLPARTKQELSNLQTTWLSFKDSEWIRNGDEFREQLRVKWGQNLESYLPEFREIVKLRRDRLNKLKADPKIQWDRLDPLQRQAVLQKSDLEFQTTLKTLPQYKTVPLSNYINTMQVSSAIVNSQTRSSPKLKVK